MGLFRYSIIVCSGRTTCRCYQTVDIVLSGLLLVGGVLGVQMGALIVQRISGEVLRMLLGIIIISLCMFLVSKLVIDPRFIFILDLL